MWGGLTLLVGDVGGLLEDGGDQGEELGWSVYDSRGCLRAGETYQAGKKHILIVDLSG